MKRAILTPAVLPASALAELKQWLAISTSQDDAPLGNLLRMGLDTFEAFTGLMPLVAGCEEIVPAGADWQTLATRPIQAITALSAIDVTGTRTPLAPGAYAIDLDADGAGRVQFLSVQSVKRIAVGFSAGLAASWDALPDGARHGIVRLAAHQHREREDSGAGPIPPASVVALWRPWRRVRLA